MVCQLAWRVPINYGFVRNGHEGNRSSILSQAHILMISSRMDDSSHRDSSHRIQLAWLHSVVVLAIIADQRRDNAPRAGIPSAQRQGSFEVISSSISAYTEYQKFGHLQS